MPSSDECWLAYVAGFFDGEGSVGVYRNGQNGAHYLQVQVTQNDSRAARALLEEVRDRWGGSIGKQSTATGRIKLGYQLHSNAAAQMLSDLLPYLRGKQEQAALASEWQRSRTPVPRAPNGRLTAKPQVEHERARQVASMLKALKVSG